MRTVTVTFTAEQAEFVRNILKTDRWECEKLAVKRRKDPLMAETMSVRVMRSTEAIEVLTAALED